MTTKIVLATPVEVSVEEIEEIIKSTERYFPITTETISPEEYEGRWSDVLDIIDKEMQSHQSRKIFSGQVNKILFIVVGDLMLLLRGDKYPDLVSKFCSSPAVKMDQRDRVRINHVGLISQVEKIYDDHFTPLIINAMHAHNLDSIATMINCKNRQHPAKSVVYLKLFLPKSIPFKVMIALLGFCLRLWPKVNIYIARVDYDYSMERNIAHIIKETAKRFNVNREIVNVNLFH